MVKVKCTREIIIEDFRNDEQNIYVGFIEGKIYEAETNEMNGHLYANDETGENLIIGDKFDDWFNEHFELQ